MAAAETAGPARPVERSAACARLLAQLLVFGEAVAGRPLEPGADACAGDVEALSVLASRGAVAGNEGAGKDVAPRTLEACRLAALWQEKLAERGVRALPLGAVAHLGRLYHDPGERLAKEAVLLVSPYDAARARLLLATGGLESTGEVTAHGVSFRSVGPPLVLRWGLAPPGWSSLPTSPFFDETMAGEAPCPGEVMAPAASWAAHRLILASGLWRPGSWTPLQLAESAALGMLVAEDDRRRWTAMVRRWGAGRLWRRADELEGWLVGGRRPGWLDEALTAAGRFPGFGEGLALQDTPARAGLFLLRRALILLKP